MWFDSFNFVCGLYNYEGYHSNIKLIHRNILVDTAPLLILVIGHYDILNNTTYIKNFQSKSEYKRYYDGMDYKLLIAFLNSLGLGDKFNLVITPQIFTEFMKHLWTLVSNKVHYKEILESCFKSKFYIKEENVCFSDCLCHTELLQKELEIGDISISIVAKKTNMVAIITDDMPFAIIVDKKYSLLTIYYEDIRKAAYTLIANKIKIPIKFLNEPQQKLI